MALVVSSVEQESFIIIVLSSFKNTSSQVLFGMRLESRKHIGSPTGQQAYAIIFTEKKISL